MSCVFEGSPDLLPSPYSELDYVGQKVSASKLLDNVTLLHKSNEPYLPPCCNNKALSSTNGDSNGSLSSDISESSECTNQEQQAELEKCRNVSPTKYAKNDVHWESYMYLEPPLIHDGQIQPDSEFKSADASLEDSSSSILGFSFPDEDRLITYDALFSTLEVEIPPHIDSFESSPLIEDDLDSPTFSMIKKLVESVLDDDDADYDDNYYNFDYDNSFMDETMAELVQRRAKLSKLKMYYQLFHCDKLNLGRDPFSLTFNSWPCHKNYHGDDKSMFQHGIMPSLEGEDKPNAK